MSDRSISLAISSDTGDCRVDEDTMGREGPEELATVNLVASWND